jgi:uncharacterized membrane protein
MRLAGLAAATAVIAYAIWTVPCFAWALVSIAMLPSTLYGRAIVSADGMTLAFAVMAIAITLHGALHAWAGSRVQHAVWMMLAALSKPPTVLLTLLLPMRCLPKDLPRCAFALGLLAVPGVAAMLAWTAATSGDIGTWRVAELTGRAAEQFDPAWKLRFMLDHPLHFPTAVAATLGDMGELWRQLIGVLGLFDTVLQLWTYPAISALLVAACLTPVQWSDARRYWIAAVAGMTALAYAAAVFLIFYLVWTPTDADQVWGVQGRYFLPCLPLFALAWCSVNRGLGERARASAAIAGATLSGIAVAEAIVRTDWQIWGA